MSLFARIIIISAILSYIHPAHAVAVDDRYYTYENTAELSSKTLKVDKLVDTVADMAKEKLLGWGIQYDLDVVLEWQNSPFFDRLLANFTTKYNIKLEDDRHALVNSFMDRHYTNHRTGFLVSYIEHEMQSLHVPGTAVTLKHKGKTLLNQGFGIKDAEKPITSPFNKVTRNTSFQLMCSSKPMVADLFQRLVNHGFYSWDDRISKHVDEFKVGNLVNLTFRDLFSMRTGLKSFAINEYWDSRRHSTMKEIADAANREIDPLKTGNSFGYQNTFYFIMADILERKFGAGGFSRLMKHYFFDPLGMASARIGIPAFDAVADRALETDSSGHFARAYPATARQGRLCELYAPSMSIDDLRKYLTHVRTTASPELETPHVRKSVNGINRLYLPATHYADEFAYGLGRFIIQTKSGKTIFTHDGGAPGWHARLAYSRDADFGLAVVTNQFDALTMHIDILPEKIMHRVVELFS